MTRTIAILLALATSQTALADEVFHIVERDGAVVSRALPSIDLACRKLPLDTTDACMAQAPDAPARTTVAEIIFASPEYRVIATNQPITFGTSLLAITINASIARN